MSKPTYHLIMLGASAQGKSTLAAALSQAGPAPQRYEELSHKSRRLARLYASGGGGNVISCESEARFYQLIDCTVTQDILTTLVTAYERFAGALFVVRASRGFTPDERAQLICARRTGITRVVVALFFDEEDSPDLIDMAELEVREGLTQSGFLGDEVSIVRLLREDVFGDPVSSLDLLRDTLDQQITDAPPELVPDCFAAQSLLAVVDYLVPTNDGLLFCCYLQKGKVKLHQSVMVFAEGREVRGRIELLGKLNPEARAVVSGYNARDLLSERLRGEQAVSAEERFACLLDLPNAEKPNLQRSLYLLAPGKLTVAKRFRAELHSFSNAALRYSYTPENRLGFFLDGVLLGEKDRAPRVDGRTRGIEGRLELSEPFEPSPRRSYSVIAHLNYAAPLYVGQRFLYTTEGSRISSEGAGQVRELIE